MQADFLNACDRHWDDAETLSQAQRWANADHLYGFSAECGLKRLMQAFGMQIEQPDGRPALSADRIHADKVWTRYESYRSGNASAAYALPSANPFSNWEASDRYANISEFDQSRVEEHKTGAKLVKDMVAKASLEGLI